MKKVMIVFLVVGVLFLTGCTSIKRNLSPLPDKNLINRVRYEEPGDSLRAIRGGGEAREIVSITYGIEDLIVTYDYFEGAKKIIAGKERVTSECLLYIYNTKTRIGLMSKAFIKWREKTGTWWGVPCEECGIGKPTYYVLVDDELHEKLVKFLHDRGPDNRSPFNMGSRLKKEGMAWIPVSDNPQFKRMFHDKPPRRKGDIAAYLSVMQQVIKPKVVLAIGKEAIEQWRLALKEKQNKKIQWLEKKQKASLSDQGKIGRIIIQNGYISTMNLGDRRLIAGPAGGIAGELHDCLNYKLYFQKGRLVNVTGLFTITLNQRLNYIPDMNVCVAFVNYSRECVDKGDLDFFPNWLGQTDRLLKRTKLTTAMLTEMILKGKIKPFNEVVDSFVEDVILNQESHLEKPGPKSTSLEK